ncbi:helix-turn-helix domain-containing protein [Arthrobacter sp. AET 35A]|uniref:helix-turn-helix domain-containing protein n=1 Tax=Arthrobacter sp. AET 35A TaxID=2292643 RepID=UPI0017840CE4|nr:helix-turn-helix domain-containing protein [Arthrobacter sp. AET 35A]MBE0011673.1 XRE family transcriptional regulator [Arthrobacter sp. AET 35A]
MKISAQSGPDQTHPPTQTIGEYLKLARNSANLTLREVENKTNKAVTNGSLSQIETGRTKRPTPNVLYHLANLYGIDYADLLRKAGHHTPVEKTPGSGVMNVPLRAIEELGDDDRQELMEYIAFLHQRRKSRGEI